MRVLTEDKVDSGELSYNHNELDANYNCSFEIGGARPSTSSSSSPLSPFSPLLLIETLSRKSFSYGKLPLEPIRLTILKLDGSSFDITVAKLNIGCCCKEPYGGTAQTGGGGCF